MRQHAGKVFRFQVRMRYAMLVNAFEDVREHLYAHLVQQLVFGFEVGVERAATDIGALDNLRHRYLAVVLFGHKLFEGQVDCLLGFALPAIHGAPFVRMRVS